MSDERATRSYRKGMLEGLLDADERDSSQARTSEATRKLTTHATRTKTPRGRGGARAEGQTRASESALADSMRPSPFLLPPVRPGRGEPATQALEPQLRHTRRPRALRSPRIAVALLSAGLAAGAALTAAVTSHAPADKPAERPPPARAAVSERRASPPTAAADQTALPTSAFGTDASSAEGGGSHPDSMRVRLPDRASPPSLGTAPATESAQGRIEQAVAALRGGDYPTALARYQALSRTRLDNPAFGVIAEILARRIARCRPDRPGRRDPEARCGDAP